MILGDLERVFKGYDIMTILVSHLQNLNTRTSLKPLESRKFFKCCDEQLQLKGLSDNITTFN